MLCNVLGLLHDGVKDFLLWITLNIELNSDRKQVNTRRLLFKISRKEKRKVTPASD